MTTAGGASRLFTAIVRGTATRPLIDIDSQFSYSPGSYYMEDIILQTGLVGIRIAATSVVRFGSSFGVPIFNGCTTEIMVDGASYTYAAFNALTPKKIVGNFGSTLVQY